MALSGRDLRYRFSIPGPGKLSIEPYSEIQFQQNGFDCILEDMKYVNTKFYLGCTREVLKMPNDLMALVCLRSSWARQGFFIPSTVVDAGFEGNLTLEIIHFGLGEPRQPIGQRFAHLVFLETTTECDPYSGKYQGQTGITHSIPDKEGE